MKNSILKITATFGLYIFWLVSISIILITTSVSNPIKTNFDSIKPYVGTFVPQGWGFFTREPKEMRFYLYIKNQQDDWVPDPDQNNLSLSNFGINRGGRSKMLQVSTIMPKLKESDWISCKDQDLSKTIIKKPKFIVFKGFNYSDFLYKEYMLVGRYIDPWHWRDFKYTGRVVRLTYIKFTK